MCYQYSVSVLLATVLVCGYLCECAYGHVRPTSGSMVHPVGVLSSGTVCAMDMRTWDMGYGTCATGMGTDISTLQCHGT